MKVLFLTADLGGNVPPTLAVAEAVAARGAEVEIAGLGPEHSALPRVAFAPATAIDPNRAGTGLRKSGAMIRLMSSRRTMEAATALIAERHAELIIVDCMLPAPLRGALDSGLPVATLFHSFGAFWIRSFDRGPAGIGLGMLGLRPRSLWARAAERLLLTDPELDPGRDDPALVDFRWTGTTERGAGPRERHDRPRVLVALSTTDWPGMLSVYRNIIAALRDLPVDAVVTTGGVDVGGSLQGAANVEVRGWAPHDEILPAVDLVIGHGGHSTTMKVLAHGIPLLILPINPISDQRLLGETVQAAGLGRVLTKRSASARIREAAEALLEDAGLRARARATGERLRSRRSGAAVAADIILALPRRR